MDMSNENAIINESTNSELVITRTLNAPRELVWKVWTEPEHVANWWGPPGFTNTIHEMDVRPGGVWDFVMHGPDGMDYRNKSIFVKVEEPELIVFDHMSVPKFQASVSFIVQGDKTLLSWKMTFESAQQLEKVIKEFGADQGLKQNVEKLENYLAE